MNPTHVMQLLALEGKAHPKVLGTKSKKLPLCTKKPCHILLILLIRRLRKWTTILSGKRSSRY